MRFLKLHRNEELIYIVAEQIVAMLPYESTGLACGAEIFLSSGMRFVVRENMEVIDKMSRIKLVEQ